jgi:hypothetical protein
MGFLDRFKRDRPMSDAELNERSKVDGIKYRDLQVVGALMQQGANLELPRHTLFFLYFPDDATARAVDAEFVRRGFQVRPAQGDTEYRMHIPEARFPFAVIAERHDKALIPDFLRETVDLCEELAAAHGGEYDGWECGPDEEQRAAHKART